VYAVWYVIWSAHGENKQPAYPITNGIGASLVSSEKDGNPLEWRVGMQREKNAA